MRNWSPYDPEHPNRHPNIYTYPTDNGEKFGTKRSYYDSQHKRRQFTKSGFDTWRKATSALKKFESDLALGKVGIATNNDMTMNQYWEIFYTRKTELKAWRSGTAKARRSDYNHWIKPRWGTTKLRAIKFRAYQQWIDDLIKTQDYARSTMRTINSLFQLIMNDAEKNEIIDRNRTHGVDIVGAKAPKNVNIEPADYKKFMQTAIKALSKYDLTMMYMASLGARREEVCGLQLRSFVPGIDEEGQYYEITYYVARTNLAPQGDDLKTENSYRKNYVRGQICDYIDFSIQHAKEICENNRIKPTPKTFLWLNARTGLPYHPANFNAKIFHPVRDASGVEARPHMLRHYFATQALQDGLPDMSVMHWLGHGSMTMTNAYTRPTKAGALNVIDGMAAKLFPTDDPEK